MVRPGVAAGAEWVGCGVGGGVGVGFLRRRLLVWRKEEEPWRVEAQQSRAACERPVSAAMIEAMEPVTSGGDAKEMSASRGQHAEYKDATVWWNFAMEHARQCKMAEPSSTTAKQLGIVATREQHCKQDHDTPAFVQLHPFGVTCYVVLQKGDRFSAVSDTAEKVLYMMNAQYNPFSHMYASAP